MNKSVLCILLMSSLSVGCSSLDTDKYLGNRITCTVAKDKAYVTSLWGIIGISSEIVKEDSKVICTPNPKATEVK